MRKLFVRLGLIGITCALIGCKSTEHAPQQAVSGSIALPLPLYESETSLEQALLERRSVREYGVEPLT